MAVTTHCCSYALARDRDIYPGRPVVRKGRDCTSAARVEGGNFIDTDGYFPFYKAEAERLRLVGSD